MKSEIAKRIIDNTSTESINTSRVYGNLITQKLTLDQILECLYNRTYEPCDVKPMIEKYIEEQCDEVQQLFTRPQEVLKPLEELYRKENPHPEDIFYIPDNTEFFKWIVSKIKNAR